MKLETVIVDEHAANILEEAKNRFHAAAEAENDQRQAELDRKSTRLNSSH